MTSLVRRTSALHMLPPARRSERLKGKTIDYSVFFKNIKLKTYTDFYESLCYWKDKRNSPHQRTPRRKPKQPHDGISTRRSRGGADSNPPINPIDRVKQTITKLTTKCKTKGLMSSILGRKFTCSTPVPIKSKCSPVSPISIGTNDDYFAHISPISPKQNNDLNVSIGDVMDISQQFAGMKKKTRKNLTCIAEEVKGRPLAEEELDELQTTIQDLDLSGYYSNKELSPGCGTRSRQQIFVAKPIDLESIGNTPRSSVFKFENNRLSPQSIRYARYVERQYCSVRRNTYNPDKPLNTTCTSLKNTKTLKMLDSTYTNVKQMLRTRRSSDSYEEDSD